MRALLGPVAALMLFSGIPAANAAIAITVNKDLQEMTVSVPAIDTGLWRDVYVALGSETSGGTWGVRLQYKPMMSWVWIGFLLAGFGAALGALPMRRKPVPAEEAGRMQGDAIVESDPSVPAGGAVA